MTRNLVDTKDRKLIAEALDQNMIVEAAAGTGKTTELVGRIVSVLRKGLAKVESLVAVTFTEKAAGELKLRMREGLERARQAASDPTERRHLEDALARLEEARVGTIHGFCADLLRERSVEAEVDPEFATMTEAEAERLFSEGFSLWLQKKLEDPPEGVRRSLRRVSTFSAGNENGPVERLRFAGWTLAEWRDFKTPWRRAEFDLKKRIAELVPLLHDFADITENCANKRKDRFYWDTEGVRRLSLEIRRAEEVRDRDYDGIEAGLVGLKESRRFRQPRKGYGREYGPGVPRDKIHEAHRRFVAMLEKFADEADADLSVLLQSELGEAVERYEELKRQTGRVDFLDLLIRARDLIRDDEPVRAEFQKRFTHIFVDEFQDTDPLQAEILLLLAGKDPSVNNWWDIDPAPGKLFLVADPKQSIYRFRRADVGIYMKVRDLLMKRGALFLKLTTSFRAVPKIQKALNAAFRDFMDGNPETLQAEFVPLSPSRSDASGQPAIVALPAPEPYGYYGITKTAIEDSLPNAVAGFVEWLVKESGWTVTERENPEERVPVSARHVCILFRRFDSFFAGDVTRGYLEALEARGIRHLLVGGRSYHEREEVETVRTALTAVEWPDDELSIFATLKGPIFAVGDEALLEYRHRFRRLHPFRIPPFSTEEEVPEHLRAVVEALKLLASLHRRRNDRPIADTINVLLETTRAHAGFVLRPSGEQALANVLHMAELARDYESTGGISFRGFVQRLIGDSEGRKAAEAPILEEGSDGVRIMTVHKAKGLEFPVVVLADMTANIARGQASRFIDSDRRLCAVRIAGWSPGELLEHQPEEVGCDVAEGVRIAYVAATRARDLLVVPTVGEGPMAGDKELSPSSTWIMPLNSAVYPHRKHWSRSQQAAGCPPFGDDTVLNRPDGHGAGGGVKPGLHDFADHDVVWWDPSILRLEVPAHFGVRREDLLSNKVDPSVVETDVRTFIQWESDRDATVTAAGTPSLRVETATERAAREEGGEGEQGEEVAVVTVIEIPRDPGRPGGVRFGSLVHAVLASVPLDADAEACRRVSALQGRILGATPEEIRAAGVAVRKVLEHSMLDRARGAAAKGQCRRETPVTLHAEDGCVVDGVVDLAFLEDDTWNVVDFKTDRELEMDLATYQRQVGLYASVIGKATGQNSVAVLMRV